MDTDAPKPPRARRAKVAKPGRAGKRHKHLRLSAEALERIAVHGQRERMGDSAVVERLVMEHLRRYVVHDMGEDAA